MRFLFLLFGWLFGQAVTANSSEGADQALPLGVDCDSSAAPSPLACSDVASAFQLVDPRAVPQPVSSCPVQRAPVDRVQQSSVVMDSTPFMNFVLRKTKSLHATMGINPSVGSSSSNISVTETQVAINQAVEESEATMKFLSDKGKDDKDGPRITVENAKEFLKKNLIKFKRHRAICALPEEVVVRRKLVQEYTSLVLRKPSASLVGTQLKDCADAEERLKVVNHCLGAKATNTLATRAVPARGYCEWADDEMMTKKFDEITDQCDDEDWSRGFWPPTEQQAYNYVQTTKSATAAKRFLETINFLVGMFGFEFGSIQRSTRIYGYAAIKMGTLGFLRKAAIFIDILICKMEIAVGLIHLPVDVRLNCGNNLAMLSTRTRNSDWHFVVWFVKTYNRLTASVARVKTSGVMDREELIISGPLVSATGTRWWDDWDDLRKAEGIRLEDGFPMSPARDSSGRWLKQPASVQEVNRISKLTVSTLMEDPTRITSHSPRRTGATLAARGGLSTDDQGTLLYHRKAGQKATRAYDESLLEGVIPKFEKAMIDIYSKIEFSEVEKKKFIQEVAQVPNHPEMSDAEELEADSSEAEQDQDEDAQEEIMPMLETKPKMKPRPKAFESDHFKEMLTDIGYDDPGAADLPVTGVEILGTLPKSGIWSEGSASSSCPVDSSPGVLQSDTHHSDDGEDVFDAWLDAPLHVVPVVPSVETEAAANRHWLCGHPCPGCDFHPRWKRPCVLDESHPGGYEACMCHRAAMDINCHRKPPKRPRFTHIESGLDDPSQWTFTLSDHAFEESSDTEPEEVVHFKPHQSDQMLDSAEVEELEAEPSTLPLASAEASSSPKGDKPPDDDDDGDDPDDPQAMAAAQGAVIHMRSGRVHLCAAHADGAVRIEKTPCGRTIDDSFEMKIDVNDFDLLCARCFKLPTVALPGRQAVRI